MSESKLFTISKQEFDNANKLWIWLLATGIILAVLGIFGLGRTAILTLASVWIFGGLLIAGGLVQIIGAFGAASWRSRVFNFLIALLYLMAGALLIANPTQSTAFLTILIGATLLITGILRIIIAVRFIGLLGWVWISLTGILGIVLGLSILIRWQDATPVVIGLLVAFELIANGASLIFVALLARFVTKAASNAVKSIET
jgi:uncharacterized membrane protein HdeD (DUF308 family)